MEYLTAEVLDDRYIADAPIQKTTDREYVETVRRPWLGPTVLTGVFSWVLIIAQLIF